MINEISDPNEFLSEFEEEGSNVIIDGVSNDIEDITIAPNFDEDSTEEDAKALVPDEAVEGTEKENSTEDDKTTDEDESEGFSYKAFLSHLNEEGIIEFEDSEDIEDKPELVYESVKKTILDGINSYKESIPETGKKFLDYLEKGGDPAKYLQTLDRPLDLDNVDLDDESDQEKVVREYLKMSDYSPEEIEETIKDYQDGLILDKQSKVAAKKLEKAFAKRSESLLQEQEQAAERQRQEYSNYITTVSNTIDQADNLAGLAITKAEKDAFRKYLLVKDKEGLTAYEREYQEKPVQTQLELAYLKFKKYDFGTAKKEGETAANKKLNWKLKNSDKVVKGGKSQVEASQDDNLAAFRAFLGKRG